MARTGGTEGHEKGDYIKTPDDLLWRNKQKWNDMQYTMEKKVPPRRWRPHVPLKCWQPSTE